MGHGGEGGQVLVTGSMAWARRSSSPRLLALSITWVWQQCPVPLNSKAHCPSQHWQHFPGSGKARVRVSCYCHFDFCSSRGSGSELLRPPPSCVVTHGSGQAATLLTRVHRQIFSIKMHNFKFEDVLSYSRSSVSLYMKCACSWNDCWC